MTTLYCKLEEEKGNFGKDEVGGSSPLGSLEKSRQLCLLFLFFLHI